MSLLSRLAAKIETLNTELAATDALGLILADPAAAEAVTAVVRAVAPHVPSQLRFTTQAADADGRPDIVGRDDRREVLHIEGKFWAGLTDAQARGGYLDRMRRQHDQLAGDDPHVGALVFVVPPRRVATLMDELVVLYKLTGRRTTGEWWYAETPDGLAVAVTSWEELLGRITGIAAQSVAEDARQLLDLVQQVDHHSFIPWTTEQRTDQDFPRRLLRLSAVLDSVHKRLLRSGVAVSVGRRQTITRGGPLAYGKLMRLGNVAVTLRLSMELWARYGRSPLWLSFNQSAAPIVRRAFPEQLVEADGWVVVPVDLPVDKGEGEVIEHLTGWLTNAGERLTTALGGDTPPPDEGEDEEPDDSDVSALSTQP